MKKIKALKTRAGLKTWTIILASLFLSVGIFSGCKKDSDTPTPDSTKYETFHKDMQKLWADHMTWTFTTVDAFYHNPSALNANLDRLLQNQKDLGAAIVPYYGQAAGDQLTKLLTNHIMLAVPVLTDAQSGDQNALNQDLANWYANADSIGVFLNNVNPAWAAIDMRPMMKTHIDQTVAYSLALLSNNYDDAITKFDEANDHMVMMADDLSEGILKQFPDMF